MFVGYVLAVWCFMDRRDAGVQPVRLRAALKVLRLVGFQATKGLFIAVHPQSSFNSRAEYGKMLSELLYE